MSGPEIQTEPSPNQVTVGMKGTDYVVMILNRDKPIQGLQLKPEDAMVVRNYLCAYMGNPTDKEIEELG